MTSTVVAAPLFRITLNPSADNGLKQPSQVMVDKAMTVKQEKVGPVFGRIDFNKLVEIERALRRRLRAHGRPLGWGFMQARPTGCN